MPGYERDEKLCILRRRALDPILQIGAEPAPGEQAVVQVKKAISLAAGRDRYPAFLLQRRIEQSEEFGLRLAARLDVQKMHLTPERRRIAIRPSPVVDEALEETRHVRAGKVCLSQDMLHLRQDRLLEAFWKLVDPSVDMGGRRWRYYTGTVVLYHRCDRLQQPGPFGHRLLPSFQRWVSPPNLMMENFYFELCGLAIVQVAS
jgi:hypothetical protein